MDLASDGSQVLALKPVTSSFRLLAFLPDEGRGGAKRCGGKGRNDRGKRNHFGSRSDGLLRKKSGGKGGDGVE
jgi:hypothetical protein